MILEEHELVGYVNFELQSNLSIKMMDLFDWLDSETYQKVCLIVGSASFKKSRKLSY